MKNAVISVVDTNFAIHSEHPNLIAAIIEYLGYCRALWNDPDVTSAMVAIVDENLDVVGHYKEYIHREA